MAKTLSVPARTLLKNMAPDADMTVVLTILAQHRVSLIVTAGGEVRAHVPRGRVPVGIPRLVRLHCVRLAAILQGATPLPPKRSTT